MMTVSKPWGVEDDLRVLRRDGYNAAANRLEKLATTINKDAEMQYMIDFIQEYDLGNPDFDIQGCKQLRALWTAFCFHHSMDVGTAGYDARLAELWANLVAHYVTWRWDEFELYMCELLV